MCNDMSISIVNNRLRSGLAQERARSLYLFVRVRATIATTLYLNHKAMPNFTSYLTSLVNNVGAQCRLSITLWIPDLITSTSGETFEQKHVQLPVHI